MPLAFLCAFHPQITQITSIKKKAGRKKAQEAQK